jgi:tape measure domain-containing protein
MAILLETVSDSKRAQDDLAKLKASVESIQTSVDKTSQKFFDMSKMIAASVGALAAGTVVTKYSDELSNLTTKLKIATETQLEFYTALNDTRRIAIDSRSDLNSIVTLYGKVSRSAKSVGASQQEVAKFTELVGKSLTVSGATVQESASAILQLSQGLASGTLAGEELRAVLESAPMLAEEFAKGLGVAVGQLKKLGEDGELTTAKLFKALLKRSSSIEDNFKKVEITFGAATKNLGTSLLILFDEVKTTVFGSKNLIADFINNIAIGISKFASNFSFMITKAKLDLKLFILDSLILFYKMEDSLKSLTLNIGELFKSSVSDLRSLLVFTSALITLGFVSSFDYLNNLFLKLKDFISNFKLDTRFIDDFRDSLEAFYNDSYKIIENIIIKIPDLFLNVIDNIKYYFSNITNYIPIIDVSNIFPNLNIALNTVRDWVYKVEGYFAWLYDKVIGNSWIPDLVTGITTWLSELLKKPLTFITEFVNSTNALFAGLKFTAPIVAGIAALSKFKSVLLGILATLSTFGLIWYSIGLNKTGNANVEIKAPTSISEKTQNYFKESLEIAKKNYELLKKNLREKGVTGTVKGFLGLDKPPEPKQDLFIGERFFNLFPESFRFPLVALLTGIFSLAITAAFSNYKNIAFGLASTAGLIFASRSVDQKLLADGFGNVAMKFLEIIKNGIDAIFYGNVARDPLGLFTLIAKTMLLFESGRKFIGEILTGIATAPTTLGVSVGSRLQQATLDATARRSERRMNELSDNIRRAYLINRQASRIQLQQLAAMRDNTGAVIGQARALQAIRTRDADAFGTQASQQIISDLIQNRQTLQKMQRDAAQSITRLETARQTAIAASGRIQENLTRQREAFRAGAINLGGGLGGTLGAVSGFQIGVEIAKSMEGSSVWSKIGVTIASSMLLQGIGSAIGATIASVLLSSVGLLGKGLLISLSWLIRGAFLLNPLVAGSTLLATALYLGYKAFTALPDSWQKDLKEKDIFGFNKQQANGGKSTLEQMGTQTEQQARERNQAVVTQVTFDQQVKKAWTDILNEGVYTALKNLSTEFEKRTGTKDPLFNYFKTNILTALQEAFEPTAVGGIYTGLKVLTEKIERLFKSPSVTVEPTKILSPEELSGPPSRVTAPTAPATPTSAITTPSPATRPTTPPIVVPPAITQIEKDKRFKELNNDLKYFNDSIAADRKLLAEATKSLDLAISKGTNTKDILVLSDIQKSVNSRIEENTEYLKKVQKQLEELKATPIKRATGGFIRGPGTGTSDSISALLSNGEFVVNARDAQKNKALLTAINSGERFDKQSSIEEISLVLGNVFKEDKEKYLDQFRTFFSNKYQLPKLPTKRLFAAEYYNRARENDSNNFKSNVLSIFGIKPDTYSRLTETQKFGVDTFYNNISGEIFKDLTKTTLANTVISAGVSSLFYSVAKKNINLLVSSLLAIDQVALPTLLGALRGKRYEQGKGNLTPKSDLDFLLKDFEEIQIGSSLEISKLISKNLESTKLSTLPDLQEILQETPDIKTQTKEAQKSRLEKLKKQIGFATGGFIRGPGTGTSDSIPAMLSNGEFVVNSRDAQKNWDVLTAINSGYSVKRFQEGTAQFVEGEAVDKGLFDRLIEALKPLTKEFPALEKLLENIKKSVDSAGKSISDSNKNLNKSFAENLREQPLDQVASTLVTELNKIGFTNITSQNLLNVKDKQLLLNIVELIEKVSEAQKKLSETPEGSFGRALASEVYSEAGKALATAMQRAGLQVSAPRGMKPEPLPGKEPVETKEGELFNIIQQNLPDLGITFDIYKRLDDSLRQQIIESAVKLKQSREKISEKVVLQDGKITQESLKNLTLAYSNLDSDVANATKNLLDKVNLLKTPFAKISALVEKSGENITESFYNLLTVEQQRILINLLNIVKDFNSQLQSTSLSQDDRRQIEQYAQRARDILRGFIETPSGKSESKQLEDRIKKVLPSASFDTSAFNRLSGPQLDKVNRAVTRLENVQPLSTTDIISPEARQKWQRNVDNLIQDLINALDDPAKKFGEDLSTAFSQGLSSGLQMVLSGKKLDENKSKLKNFIDVIMESVSQSVIKSLSEGFAQAFKKNMALEAAGEEIYNFGAKLFTKAFSFIMDDLGLKAISEKVYEFGSKIFGGLFESFSKTIGTGKEFETLFNNALGFISDSVGKIFKSFTDIDLSGIISQAGTLLKQGLNFLLAMVGIPGFANGGYVSGSGTGTSDSIPAMLSNGEFIVNANATRKNFKLLSAINDGKSLLMANGGLVDTNITKVPDVLSFDNTSSKSSNSNPQIININITGDISRQTKAEIFKMLPTIADGVNMQNRERNYRG